MTKQISPKDVLSVYVDKSCIDHSRVEVIAVSQFGAEIYVRRIDGSRPPEWIPTGWVL